MHRFLSIQDEAAEVLKVKRSGSVMIENPYTIPEEATIREARKYAEDMGISGLLVVDGERLAGIVTDRDFLFGSDQDRPISSIMTRDVVTAPSGISVEDAKRMLRDNRVEKLPVTDGEGRIRGLFTSKDITNIEDYPMASKDSKGRPLVGAAVGVKGGLYGTDRGAAGGGRRHHSGGRGARAQPERHIRRAEHQEGVPQLRDHSGKRGHRRRGAGPDKRGGGRREGGRGVRLHMHNPGYNRIRRPPS